MQHPDNHRITWNYVRRTCCDKIPRGTSTHLYTNAPVLPRNLQLLTTLPGPPESLRGRSPLHSCTPLCLPWFWSYRGDPSANAHSSTSNGSHLTLPRIVFLDSHFLFHILFLSSIVCRIVVIFLFLGVSCLIVIKKYLFYKNN